MHWKWALAGARPRHVPVVWSRTGCKADLELSSRRCCILIRGYKLKTFCGTGSCRPSAARAVVVELSSRLCCFGAASIRRCTLSATGPLVAKAGPGKGHTDIRIEGLFLLCGGNDVCYKVSIRFRTKNQFFSRSSSKQMFSSDDNKWQIIDFR